MRSTTTGLVLAAALVAFITPAAVASEGAPIDSSKAVSAPPDSADVQPEAILYYFHRTLRCHTCLTIEAYIDEAVRTHFADDLEDGRLLWCPTNIDEPENLHFEEDFALEFNSAIFVQLKERGIASWTNLERVWDLLEAKEEFVDYIRENVEPTLAGDSGDAPLEEQW